VTSRTDLPSCCERRGLNFDDGAQRACARHMTPEQSALVAELDQRARGVLTAPDHWPYGPNIDVETRRRMLDWADQYSLPHVDPSHICPRRLELGYCRKGWQCPDRVDGRGWSDHPTMWADRDSHKAVVIVGQPYGLGDDERAEAADVAARHGLRAEVRELGSWYGHGTSFVGLWIAGSGPALLPS
jgi:hypothetical protein